MIKKDSSQVSKILIMGRIVSVFTSDETATTVEEVKSWSVSPGGVAAHVAFALANLGSKATFIGCVGNDDTGLALKKTLQEYSVDTQGVRVVNDSQTGWIWSLRHTDGDCSFHSPQLSLEHFADSQLSSFDIDPIWFEKSVFFVPQASILGPERSRAGVNYAKELVEQARGITFLDVNFRRFAWETREEGIAETIKFARTCEMIQISLEDAKLFFNVDSVKKLSALLPKARGILLTKGAGGCEYLLDGNLSAVPGLKVLVIDSSLAGDAFLAAFISKVAQFGMDSLKDPEACRDYVSFANAAGAIAVTKMRSLASFPGVKDIEQVLAFSKFPEAIAHSG